VKITADTNVLLRDVLQDDPVQSRIAGRTLQSAELVVVPVAVLCELVWVLRQGYKRSGREVLRSIRLLLDSSNVVTNRLAVEIGLRVLEAGGDFADGALAYEGEWLGAEEFVSFDRKAVTLLKAQGKKARLLT
jgi:predicted nucleic-acid-binding protein